MTRHDGTFESERAGATPKVYHHPSTTIVPSAPAGGEVPRHQYEDKVPRTPSVGDGNRPNNEVGK
jgi:hypothetical protein